MNPSKLSSVVFTVTVSVALVASLALSKDQHGNKRQLTGGSVNPYIADGGAPVPPLPPPKHWSRTNLIADGGAPVPPLPPPKPTRQFLAA